MLHFFLYANDVIVMFCISEYISSIKNELHDVIAIIAFIIQNNGTILDHISVHMQNKGTLNTVFHPCHGNNSFNEHG